MKRLISAILASSLFIFSSVGATENPRVKIETNLGDIVLELNAQKAPKTVENFLRYVEEGHYQGTIFHRVIANFMIQGGGYTTDYSKKPTHEAVENEAFNGLRNERGSIAMARTGEPHSATAQFFINVLDNGSLNYRSKTPRGWGYTVFGKVVEGMDTVDKIRDVPTGRGGPFRSDAPQSKVIIENVTLLNKVGKDHD